MSEYAVLKLVTAETVICEVMYENDELLFVRNPISIKYVPNHKDGRLYEKTIALPFCALTQEKDFEFKKSTILFIKQLDPGIVEYYIDVVAEYEQEDEEESPKVINKVQRSFH